MERWPNFLIVGVPRAGTTSLYQYLSQHPKIFMSPEKEPAYFQKIITLGRLRPQIRTEKEYLKLFKNVKDEKAIGEASPGYLTDPEAPYLIHKKIPDVKIIVMLRDPVERSFSAYLLAHALPGLQKNLSFIDVVKRDIEKGKNGQIPGFTIKNSLYTKGVKTYLELFGTKRVKICIYEEWTKDVKGTVKEILKFLDLGDVLHNFETEKYNPTRIPKGRLQKVIVESSLVKKLTYRLMSTRTAMKFAKKIFYKADIEKPQMRPEDRLFLEDLFREDAIKLQELLGRPVPWSLLAKKK